MTLMTSESVTPGHPDKLCDQISDAILDEHLRQDENARVAVETFATAQGIYLGGEIASTGHVDHEAIVRSVIREVGYREASGLDPSTVRIEDHTHTQSQEISQAVTTSADEGDLGAGDQGMAIGYATDETPECLPVPLVLAHRLAQTLHAYAGEDDYSTFYPDGKTQVTAAYRGQFPTRIPTVVVSTQHSDRMPLELVRDLIRANVIDPVMETVEGDTSRLQALINPAGSWTHGGPKADTGLTGRKIIVDTYGGFAAHGGGAFSGKDPSKVDRSAAYAARQAAKYLVTTGKARRAQVMLAYAIGHSHPVSVTVDTFGTGSVSDAILLDVIRARYDFRPAAIIERLGLRRPRYRETAVYGHFTNQNWPWERP